MSFKRNLLLSIAAVLGLASTGCSDFMNGQKAPKEEIKFSNDRLACLKDVPRTLKKFTVGTAKEAEIRDGFDCLRDGLTYFQKKTYGAQGNAYTMDEMRRFFSKYFLKENVVTPEFAQELMKIKKALLGGSVQTLTKEEITRLVDVLAITRDEAVKLSPHVQVLLNQLPNKKSDFERVSSAVEQVRSSFQRLLERTELSKSEYSLDDAKAAFSGFSDFIKGTEPFAPYEQYSKVIPIVESVKNVLMGREAQIVTLRQWKDSLDTLVDLYGLALKYHYVIHNFDVSSESKVREVSQFIGQGLDLIEHCHQMKTKGLIPLEDLDSLIETAMPVLKLDIREMSIKRLYRAGILRLLDAHRNGDSRGILGLDKGHLASLRREFNVWRLNQNFIDAVSAESRGQAMTQESLLKSYREMGNGNSLQKGFSNDPYEQTALQNAWIDLGEQLKAPVLLTYNKHGRMFEVDAHITLPTSWKSLTKSNLMRAMSRGLMLAYGDNQAGVLSEARLSRKGLITWYEDFTDLMTDLKAFDPRTGNTGGRSFLEANFFTFSGNGDDSMDIRETYEFVSVLFSAGLSSASDIQTDIESSGCAVNVKDIFGNRYLNENCFQARLRKGFGGYFDNLPNMASYVARMNDTQWNDFYNSLKSASLAPDQRPHLIETANVRTMVTIVHYVEAIMVVYDRDRNQTLSLDEVYAATPRFMAFLQGLGKSSSDTLLKQGFAYLVFYGRIPGAWDLTAFQAKKIWLGEATRSDILRLFGSLKDQLNTK
ncbi:MAG: hypothetical protein ACKOX6_04175 [Bdellovibrio sp.]